MAITSTDIYKLLELKYPIEKFLTIAECKIGSTWFKTACSRFDMWVMARSWQNPRFIGCEIKVSRQDFLNDNKWQNYLPYCTELYFVASHGIIDSSEVPEQAGLLEATKNCKRLILKKKAPVRDIEIPQSLLVYILMCRARITADNTEQSKASLWADRLKEMEANKRIGSSVAWHIRDLANKQVKAVIEENKKLRDENRILQQIKECMESLGINAEEVRYGGRSRIEQKIKESLSGIPFDLPMFLERIKSGADEALKVLRSRQSD